LTAYLENHPDSFDLIVSADTLVYFGDLDAVSRVARAALRPLGYLVFTVEQAAEGTYRLNPHGRYSHSGEYVRRVLEDAGLFVIAIDATTLRMENEVPVAGWIVSARRPA
jgi:predicted TPR repeat methyltransferase